VAAPVYSDGQVLTGADCTQWFTPVAAYKTADTGRATTTAAADPDLTVTVAANAFYNVRIRLFYKCTSTTPNFKWTAFTLPASASPTLYSASYTGSGGGLIGNESNQWNDASHLAAVSVANQIFVVGIEGMLVTSGSSGTFAVNWAADSAAGTMTLTSRSFMHLTRVG